MSRAARPLTAALAACLLLSVSAHALAFQPGDRMPDDLVVPTLDGNLTVPRDGSANKPLLAIGLDPADPFSTAMWVAPASLDALLFKAPEGAHFLFFSHSNDSAEADVKWMQQRLLSRDQALQLPSERLTDLLQRLHFASQPPTAVGGWLPQLLAQWQLPRRIVRAKAQPQVQPQREGSGSSTSKSSSSSSEQQAATVTLAQGGLAAAQQEAGQQPLRSIASGRLDAFYGWLPWPLTGLQGDLAFAGWDCEWIRADRRLHSHLNGSVAMVALSAFPGDSSEAAEVQLADVEPALRRSSSSSNSGGSSGGGGSRGTGSTGSSSSTGPTADNRRQPRARCSYARILQAAEAAGATAVMLAAPAGRYPREANCSCAEECSAEVSIPATMVPHSVGVVLRDVLRAGDRVNVSFEEEQGPGLWAGIDTSGALFELGWPKVASLLHGVWAAQYQGYLQGLSERLAGPAQVIPIFKGDKALDASGRPLRKSLALPNWSKLAGKDRLELDMQLSCQGSSDADCPTYDHVVQLFVCCGTADGMLPPCDPCQPTVWAASDGSSRASSSGGGATGGGASRTSLHLLPSADARHNGSARALAAAWQEQPALVQEGLPNGKLCGRELGRWVTPFRRRVGRWLTDVSALRPLLLPAPRLLRPQCTFTLQAPAWAGPWKPTLSLRFSSSPTEVRTMAEDDSGGSSSSSDPPSSNGSSSSSSADSVGSTSRQAAEAAESGMPPHPQQQPHQRCSDTAAVQRAQRVLPMPFAGGDFGPGYNNRSAGGFNFVTPPGLRRALLVARITGHGWGPETEGCAEFCGTQHSFWVNGEAQYEYSIRFERAGQLWACADQVPNGVVPNQHGTFLYGRNGWCPGQDVAPWVADVTAALSPEGQPNSIAYRGVLLNGSEPLRPAGVLLMQSNLVFQLGC